MGPAKPTLEQDEDAPERSNGPSSLVAGRGSVGASQDGYAPGNDRPLAGYAALMGVYGAAVAAGAGALRHRNRPLPDVRLFDIALVGVATHKLARRVTKDSVTAFSERHSPATRGLPARPSSRRASGARACERQSGNWSPAPSASASGWRRASHSAC